MRICPVALLLALALLGCGDGSVAPPIAPPPGPPQMLAARGPQVVWAVGDGANGSARAKAVARMIAGERPARVIYLGDVYPRGTPHDFRVNFGGVYGSLVRRMLPTPGNHEWPRHRTGYDRYWRRVKGRTMPSWYAVRIAGWTLLSLNSEVPADPQSPQGRWLEEAVREPSTCRIAFWHRPRHSAGLHGDSDRAQDLWDGVRGRAALVLSGHDHGLQRFKPIDGITQIVSGAGGRHLYPVNEADVRLAFADDDHFGGVRLVLRPGIARLDFVGRGRRLLDRSYVRCQR